MRPVYRITCILVFLLFSYNGFSQNTILRDSSVSATLINIGLGYSFPGGDLKDRFGNCGVFQVGVIEKFRSNWLIGLKGDLFFGDDVREDTILKNLANSSGFITNSSGAPANIQLLERGFAIDLTIGKILPFLDANSNSGLTITGGLGFLQHKIRINNSANDVPQLEGNYKKGYDRLSNGLRLTEFVGYTYLSANKLANFQIGMEFTQAWTKNRRDINFDTQQQDKKTRNDLMYALKLIWILPLYHEIVEKEFYY